MSRIKLGLNKTSQQKVKRLHKTLRDFIFIENIADFVSKFEKILAKEIYSLRSCSERAITDYYIKNLLLNLEKVKSLPHDFFDKLVEQTRQQLAGHYTNKTFDNNIDRYFNAVKREYILHPQNESNELEFIPENRDIFIKNNLKLVVNCAKRYLDNGLPFEDLIQAGNVGLLTAFEKFDTERGNLRFAINKKITESELETFTYEDACKIVKSGFTYDDDLELTLSKIPKEGIPSKDAFYAWVKSNVKTAVFASVAFKWIRAYILLELNKYAKIVKPQKLTVNKDDLEYQEFLKENDIYDYEVATENPLTVINLDSVNPYTDDCYHDNDLQEVTQEEFLIEDEALENEERTNTFKEIVNDVLFKLNALDRRIIKKRFGIGLPYEMSIQEIADSENITINKVKYSLSSSFKQIKNYIRPEDLKSLYESL